MQKHHQTRLRDYLYIHYNMTLTRYVFSSIIAICIQTFKQGSVKETLSTRVVSKVLTSVTKIKNKLIICVAYVFMPSKAHNECINMSPIHSIFPCRTKTPLSKNDMANKSPFMNLLSRTKDLSLIKQLGQTPLHEFYNQDNMELLTFMLSTFPANG